MRDSRVLRRNFGYKLVVVLGEPAYYGRFGFMPARNVGLEDEYDGGDAFQAIKLISEIELGFGGVVRYEQEFSAV